MYANLTISLPPDRIDMTVRGDVLLQLVALQSRLNSMASHTPPDDIPVFALRFTAYIARANGTALPVEMEAVLTPNTQPTVRPVDPDLAITLRALAAVRAGR